jgi:hypothetical protein
MYINHGKPLQTVKMLPHETLRGEKKADLAGAALSIFRSAAGLWSARGADDTAVRHVWFTEVSPDDASSFQEVQNSQLADALKKESVFTRDEMQAFGIDMSFWAAERALDLKYCIYVDGKRLQMHAGDLASSAETVYPAPKRFRRSDRVLASTAGGLEDDAAGAYMVGRGEEEPGIDMKRMQDDVGGDELQKAVDNLKKNIRDFQNEIPNARINEFIKNINLQNIKKMEQVQDVMEELQQMADQFSGNEDDELDKAVDNLREKIKEVQKDMPSTSMNAFIENINLRDIREMDQVHDIIDKLQQMASEFLENEDPSPPAVDSDETMKPRAMSPVAVKMEPPTADKTEPINPISPQPDNDKSAFPSTATPGATDANLQDIVTRAIHDGVAGALRDLNPEPSPTVEIPASEPTELVLGHDYDFLASIAQSARFGKRVTPADVLCAGMAANLTVATARQMTFDYRRRFNAPAPNAEAMAMEDLSGYTREVLLAFRLLDVCLKPQWTRVGTQKRIELEFYSAVKDAVEATMSRR